MTEHQRILALEAALCAIEGPRCPVDLQPLVSQLHEKIDTLIHNIDESFDKYLADQREAVNALAENTAVFGGPLP